MTKSNSQAQLNFPIHNYTQELYGTQDIYSEDLSWYFKIPRIL